MRARTFFTVIGQAVHVMSGTDSVVVRMAAYPVVQMSAVDSTAASDFIKAPKMLIRHQDNSGRAKNADRDQHSAATIQSGFLDSPLVRQYAYSIGLHPTAGRRHPGYSSTYRRPRSRFVT